ncbi:MAG: 2-dehydropantoate 2-reductase [Chloroflexi bacterium]|nr:MAG: 2-dehydropantoate 2-reductase [Chloroflexota bacterium]
MKILIIGAGAIGCLVGGKLALAGHEVTLAGRPRFAAAVQVQGLLLHDIDGAHVVRNVVAVGAIAEAFASAEARFDAAIITVKSYHTEGAIAELVAAAQGGGASSPACVLSLQNGIGNEAMIATTVGAEHVIAGTITTPVIVAAPGVIVVEKPDPCIGLSPWSPATAKALLTNLAAALRTAGFAVRRYGDAAAMKWTKLLMNMVANATCAILDESPATAFAHPGVVDLELAAWREALAVMRRAGIQPVNLGPYPFRILAPLIRTLPNAILRPILRRWVADARGNKMPSLHIDLHSSREQSEIHWLNGAIVEKGQEVGIATPVNTALTRTLCALVAREDDLAEWRHNHQRLIAAVRATPRI